MGLLDSVFGTLAGAVEPVTKLIDELHTSDEERLTIKQAMFGMQADLTGKMLAYESQILEAQKSIIIAEAQGGSWLQRSWRPIAMLTFLALVVADSFGLLAFRLADEAWTLLQIGLGGYTVGRTLEKITPQISQVMKKD